MLGRWLPERGKMINLRQPRLLTELLLKHTVADILSTTIVQYC